MARPRVFDLLQVYPFWVFDAALASLGLPVFDPLLGFSAATTPEITTELRQIQPGNWEFKRQVVKAAEVAPITLSRGVRFYDSDFYNWITAAILGREPVRRDLVLVHFMGFRPLSQLTGANLSYPDVGLVQFALRLPGKAWMLYDCVPTRYKAGSDFDATSSEVSIQELEVQPEHIAELSVSTLLRPPAGFGVSVGLGVVSALV